MPKKLEPPKYSSTHKWVRKIFGKAQEKVCSKCHKKHKRMEWANLSGKYKRIIEDWIVLCNPCHQKLDNSGFYVLRKEKIKKLCEKCKKIFFVFPYRKTTAKWCSVNCYKKQRGNL